MSFVPPTVCTFLAEVLEHTDKKYTNNSSNETTKALQLSWTPLQILIEVTWLAMCPLELKRNVDGNISYVSYLTKNIRVLQNIFPTITGEIVKPVCVALISH